VADGGISTVDPEHDLASRRRARKWWWALGLFALLAVGAMAWLGTRSESDAPSAPRAFCRAADRYEAELQRQAVDYERDLGRQITYVEEIARTAPRAVRADADRFLDALRRLQAAPDDAARRALQDDAAVERAVDNVNRYWNQRCGVFDRQGGL
jgi:hypothetical protein